METIQIQTAQNVAIQTEVAGLGDRVLAALIDYFLLAAYLVVIFLSLGVVGQLGGTGESLALTIVFVLPAALYFLLCEVLFEGQSVGKHLRKIRVVRLDGRPPRLGDYLLRWLLRPVDLWLFSGLVAVVTVLLTGTGQRLGDLVAGTAVVKAMRRVDLDETLLARLDEAYRPTFPQAERLSEADAATAREVLNVLITGGKSRTAYQLGIRTKAVLEQKLGVASDLAPLLFLRTLLNDYNHFKGRL